jgi:hypothetical protein
VGRSIVIVQSVFLIANRAKPGGAAALGGKDRVLKAAIPLLYPTDGGWNSSHLNRKYVESVSAWRASGIYAPPLEARCPLPLPFDKNWDKAIGAKALAARDGAPAEAENGRGHARLQTNYLIINNIKARTGAETPG